MHLTGGKQSPDTCKPDTNGLTTPQLLQLAESSKLSFWGDINGDGLTDFISKPATPSDQHIGWRLNTGSGFGPMQRANGVPAAAHANFVVDLNGDGKSDWVTKDMQGGISWSLSNGNGFDSTKFSDGNLSLCPSRSLSWVIRISVSVS